MVVIRYTAFSVLASTVIYGRITVYGILVGQYVCVVCTVVSNVYFYQRAETSRWSREQRVDQSIRDRSSLTADQDTSQKHVFSAIQSTIPPSIKITAKIFIISIIRDIDQTDFIILLLLVA
jgi:hypothetical protein